MTNENPKFYSLVGPLLSRRDIVAELGSPVWDDDGKTWIIGKELGAVVVGTCAFVTHHDHVRFCSDYVAEERRKSGLYEQLFKKRDSLVVGWRAIATVTEASLPTYRRHGFSVVGKTGRYFRVERGGDAEGQDQV